MAKCFSFTATRDRCLRFSFSRSGLKSTVTDVGDGTVMHCWVPKRPNPARPDLLLLHGIGANAMWQWNDFVSPLAARFNVYVPDLVFFGDSYTTRPERSEQFQAQCVVALMEAIGVKKMNVVGMSYGGFVAYSLAVQFGDRVDKLVLICAGVCLEEKDMEEGMFRVRSVDEAVSVLLPQPEKVRDLMRISFHRPPKKMPTCFLQDFIDVMCTEYLQERIELITALHKDRKLSNLPKLAKHDAVFPMELAERLKRHVDGDAQLVVIKDAGHAINAEKPKEMYKILKTYLVDPPTSHEPGNQMNGRKAD
ncbi:hypothetical protein NL676_019800 [Syzygium grande]|nr:hypothetical protein NL676_019800 [Syzygium grande]